MSSNKWHYEGSLNCDNYDDEYMQRTGIGVACDYWAHKDGTVAYGLYALKEKEGGWDAGWSEEQFASYWAERGSFWRWQANDEAATRSVVRVWHGGMRGGAQVCFVQLSAG